MSFSLGPAGGYAPLEDDQINLLLEDESTQTENVDFIFITKIFATSVHCLNLYNSSSNVPQSQVVGMSLHDLKLLFKDSQPYRVIVGDDAYLATPIANLSPGTMIVKTSDYNKYAEKNLAVCNPCNKIAPLTHATVEMITNSVVSFTSKKKLMKVINNFAKNCGFLFYNTSYYPLAKQFPDFSFKVITEEKSVLYLRFDENTKLSMRVKRNQGIVEGNAPDLVLSDKIVTSDCDFVLKVIPYTSKPVEVSRTDIEECIKKYLLHKDLAFDYRYKFDYCGADYCLTLESVSTPKKTYAPATHADRLTHFRFSENSSFMLQPEDRLVIKAAEKNLMEEELSPEQSMAPPPASFTEFAVKRGFFVPEELATAIDSFVKYHRSPGPLKAIALERELLPETGILLYGPPGNGKSSFADLAIKYLIEIKLLEKENATLMPTTELLHSLVGDTEKSIHDLFRKAKEDSRRLGDKSPIHVIALDEFEGVVSNRTGARNAWEVTTVNAFLAEWGSLVKATNILFIAMTNLKEKIDTSFLREGRFGSQILIGDPNPIQRKTLLKHLLSQQKECLRPDNIEELVRASQGLSFANITGAIKKANMQAFNRLSELYDNGITSKEQLDSSAQGQITMNDLIPLFKKSASSKEEAPPNMYI